MRRLLRHHCLRQRPSVGGCASQFALRAHPTRPLRSWCISLFGEPGVFATGAFRVRTPERHCFTMLTSFGGYEIGGHLEDRGDVLPARTSAQGRVADDVRSGSCDPAGSLRSANLTPSARANSGDCRDCHGDDCPAHDARRIDLSVHCGFLLLWLVCRSALLTMRRARSACCPISRAGPSCVI